MECFDEICFQPLAMDNFRRWGWIWITLASFPEDDFEPAEPEELEDWEELYFDPPPADDDEDSVFDDFDFEADDPPDVLPLMADDE